MENGSVLPFSIPGVRYRRPDHCGGISPSSGNGPPSQRNIIYWGRNQFGVAETPFCFYFVRNRSQGRLVDCDRSTVNSVRVFENGGLRDTRTVRVPMNCRPSLAAGALEYRHVNLNYFLVRSLCRQTYLSGSSVSASSGIFYGNGGSITAILPFSIRGSVFGGDRLLRDSTRVEA